MLATSSFSPPVSLAPACCSVKFPTTRRQAVLHFAWQHWQSPCPDTPDSLRAGAGDADGSDATVEVASLCQDTLDTLCSGADADNAAVKVLAACAALGAPAGALPIASTTSRQPGTRQELPSQSWDCPQEFKLSKKLALQHFRTAQARGSSQRASSSQRRIVMETMEEEAMSKWKRDKVISFAQLRFVLQEEELLEASVARVRPLRAQKGGKKLQSSVN